MHNEQNEQISPNNSNIESTSDITEYKPLESTFFYDKDFLDNLETLKTAKKQIITLRLQEKRNEALPYLEEAIKHGDLQSMIWLGEHYEINGDLLKAIRWYVFAFHLHWLETFEHHPIIVKKFDILKEKYTKITYHGKNKKKISVKFNDIFDNLPINNNEKKEIKELLTKLASPKNNFYDLYIKPSSHLNSIFLNKVEKEIQYIINNNALLIKNCDKEKLLSKSRQKIYLKKIKLLNESQEKEINELHLILGFQYYVGLILNIDGSLNYTKTLEHFLEAQDYERNHEFNDLCSEANYVLKELYFEEKVDFQQILDDPFEKKYHEKIKNFIHELSIQENIEIFSNEYKNKNENSNDIEKIIQLIHLYKQKIIGKNLSKNEKKEQISILEKKGLNILKNKDHKTDKFLYKGYIFYYTKQYEKARKNFLLALENKVNFDTSIINLIDAHIQAEENLKNLEQEDNTIEDFSEPTPNLINDLDTNEEPSTEDLSSNIISESSQKTTITKEVKQQIKNNRIQYKIQKNYERIKKRQQNFKEKQKNHGIFLNKNISTQENRNRKILFSSEKKPLNNRQKEIKQQYELLINENEKFQRLIKDIKNNPWSGGEGQVEHLKHRGSYSRRINHCDRLEYRINSDGNIVILAVEGHYDD